MSGVSRRAMVGAGLVLVLVSAAWLYLGGPGRAPKRPRYVFVNETERHDYDTALKTSLKLAERRSGIENALVLLKKLPPGSTIESVAEGLFQRWQIGRDRSGKGILYVHSEEENLFKIEVSYALEGIFPDVVCHRLEDAARTYMLSEIPQDFVTELMITMNIEAAEASKAEKPDADLDLAPSASVSRFLSGGAGVAARGYRRTLADYLKAVRELPAEDVGAFRPARDAAESVRQYLASLERGLGDPRLPLLTEGSQVFRLVVPRNPAQQRRVLDYYERGSPHQIYVRGDLGIALFRAGVPNLPIVLRRSRDGLWYVDEAKSWTWFHRWEDGTDPFPKYDDMPLLFALKEARYPTAERVIYTRRVATPAPPSYPFSLEEAVSIVADKMRKDPADAEWPARLGEIYLFEVDWISKAIDCFETAAHLAPDRLEYRWRLYDLYINHSEVEKAMAELHFLADKLPGDAEVQHWLKFYTDTYSSAPGEFP